MNVKPNLTKKCKPMISYKNDIVHKEAFNVLKKDLLSKMQLRKDISFLKALGLEVDLAHFVKDNVDHIFKIMQCQSKTEAIQYILSISDTLHEYTAYLFIYVSIEITSSTLKNFDLDQLLDNLFGSINTED